MAKVFVVFCFVLSVCAGPAKAEEAMVVERGTEGLVGVPFRVVNESRRPIACSAAIAHWYSARIGSVAPWRRLEAKLWSKPATGEVFLLNETQDRMPVQRLWCGYAGADVSTRSEIGLLRRAETAEPPIELVCSSGGESQALDCRRRQGE
ncbi:hypothetical protein [Ancylobacter oerskovii]|uniref:Uncharacterized protein n=1 Tax=Ancylobacter oerskovii TaxID=459519 RepID=A0ABW4YVU9_9HYPH|nr:hypothetical protein [Ancylobacter oerskovii]MBS7543103.1 hypothetical protein [Ancylobacter oerskovii]